MLKRIGTAMDDEDEAILRTREQDDEFCRRLRVAIEKGQEFCPIGVSTEPGTKRPAAVNKQDQKAYMREYMRRRRRSQSG